jgi:putative acetyltransferase
VEEHVVEIKIDDLCGDDIALFLQEHIEDMKSVSPPESKHALDLDTLRQPDITFWSVWAQGDLAGCGAIKELNNEHAEIKSMRTSSAYKQRGIASTLLQYIIEESKRRGYQRLSLETGSMSFFTPARSLYEKYGFIYCKPFFNYKEDQNSVFMTKKL